MDINNDIIFNGKIIRVFLSYSNKDKDIAGKIKSKLESSGLEVFLAHEDIEPSQDWQQEIIKNLYECDIFIPLISKDFKESNWTDQESGIAFGLKKYIIPICIDLLPYGFLSRYQAKKLKDNIHEACNEILKIIIKSPQGRNFLIMQFLRSDDYLTANKRTDVMYDLEPFSQEEAIQIITGFMDNNQLVTSKAFRFIESIYKKYSESLNLELRKKYEKIIRLRTL